MKRNSPEPAISSEDIEKIRAEAKQANERGGALLKDNQFEEAIKCFNKSIELLNSLEQLQSDEDKRLIVRSYSNIGVAYFKQNKFQVAISFYQAAISILKSLPQQSDEDKRQMAVVYHNIGAAYVKQNKFQEEISSRQEAITILKSLLQQSDEDKRQMARIYDHIGAAYFKQNKFQETISSYQAAISILKSLPQQSDEDKRQIVRSYNNIGAAYFKQNKFLEAISSRQEGLVLYDQITDQTVMQSVLLDVREIVKGLARSYTSAITNKLFIHIEDGKKALQRGVDILFTEEKFNYSQASQCYGSLCQINLPHSLEYQLYFFASSLFIEQRDAFQFHIQYQQLLAEVLNVPILSTPKIHQQLLQILECVEKNVGSSDFPNQAVKTYLSDAANMKMFKEHIQKLKQAIEVPTLLATASHSPHLILDLVLGFKALQGKMEFLEKENKELKEKVERLEAQQNSKSAYETNMTLFPSSSSASLSNFSDNLNPEASFEKKM